MFIRRLDRHPVNRFSPVRMLITVMLILILGICACGRTDGPPADNGKELSALTGVFSYGENALLFNGDGQFVIIDITPGFAEKSGLPEGKSEGTYVFLFHNGSYRRDQAEYFRIRIGDKNYQFANVLGVTGEDRIGFYLPDMEEKVTFERNS